MRNSALLATPEARKSDGPADSLTRLLTPPEAQRVLAIGARKLWQITNCGELAAVRIGRAVRYDPADLAAYIEARKQR